MKNIPIAVACIALLPLLGTAQTDPPPPPAMTTMEQLLQRPELWPLQCKVLKAYVYGEESLSLDATYAVVDIDKANVVIELKSGKTGTIPHADTTVLADANAAFAKMSPAQRALDLEMLKKRADLWPSKVAMRSLVTMGEGSERREFLKGSELDFGTFDGTWVKARNKDFDAAPVFKLWQTDLVLRVRQAIDQKPRGDGHRVLVDLDGKLVNLRTGKKARLNAKNPPDYVLLYFSAGWCGPCHNFSPQLVQFYQLHKKEAGKRFEIIWISRDHSEAEMQEYAKTFGFPWLAVAWNQLSAIPVAQAHDVDGIPDLVMLDAKGALVADSYVGQDYRGAAAVLDVLKQRLGPPK